MLAIATPSVAKPGNGHGQGQNHTYGYDDHGKGQLYGYGLGGCPPGLAKKGNGCQPPGQAKKRYAVGKPLPAGVVLQAVPADLLRRLGAPPPGYVYGSVDGDVLKMSATTKLVVDAIEALMN